MTATFSEASDEINSQFWLAWKAGAAAIVGYLPEVRWQNDQETETPDGSKFWARVSQQIVLASQTTLANQVSGPDKKRYTASGLVFVQIFCPKSLTTSDQLGRQLAELAQNAYRGKSTSGCIWFRNVRINPLPPEALFYRFNVVAEFEYDDIA